MTFLCVCIYVYEKVNTLAANVGGLPASVNLESRTPFQTHAETNNSEMSPCPPSPQLSLLHMHSVICWLIQLQVGTSALLTHGLAPLGWKEMRKKSSLELLHVPVSSWISS